MRILLDEQHLDWDEAWAITVASFGYTNHTLLPEALETWPLAMFGDFLPRHLEIIYEINRRFLDEVRARFPGDEERVQRMSLIGEEGERACAWRIWPRSAATPSTASPRCTPSCSHPVCSRTSTSCGRSGSPTRPTASRRGASWRWPTRGSASCSTTPSATAGWWTSRGFATSSRMPTTPRSVASGARSSGPTRRALADYVRSTTGVELNPDSLFDIQVKRIHEYKRQQLNVLHIITLYHRLKQNPDLAIPPRAFIFGGKAAPGYFMAKRIIKLINAVGETVNADPDVNQCLKVAFVPNFNVQNAHLIYPAADLSEQISTAGKEASGTGNMKFMLNGALTIGTLDGANVEIRDEVGAENFFLFGLTVAEVERIKCEGYRPADYIGRNDELKAVLELIASGRFSHGDTDVFHPLVESLTDHDPFLVLADYAAYVDCQDRVSAAWQDTEAWTRMSILNTAQRQVFVGPRHRRVLRRHLERRTRDRQGVTTRHQSMLLPPLT